MPRLYSGTTARASLAQASLGSAGSGLFTFSLDKSSSSSNSHPKTNKPELAKEKDNLILSLWNPKLLQQKLF
jgi:hypothetical protein